MSNGMREVIPRKNKKNKVYISFLYVFFFRFFAPSSVFAIKNKYKKRFSNTIFVHSFFC